LRPSSRRDFLGSLGALALAPAALARADVSTVDMKTFTYASPGGKDLLLDLFIPRGATKSLATIIFLHGGGWSAGTRTTGPDFRRFFAQDGFAMATIEYRLAPLITFPSNVEDTKTAIRWLRANATANGLDPKRMGLWGTSAGATLACVAALCPSGMFEGEGNLDQSSAVQCVLDAYGPTFFTLMDVETEQEKTTLQLQPAALANAAPMVGGVVTTDSGAAGRRAPAAGGRAPAGPGVAVPHDDPNSAESRLVGAPIQTVPEKVKAASALTYVHHGAPPFLIMHGLADNSVPHQQSILLYESMVAAGNDVTLRLVDGLPHTFFNRTNLDELAGPFRMDVRTHPASGTETYSVDRAGVFDVARRFFKEHLG
jgi:acetyl esterase/lipase